MTEFSFKEFKPTMIFLGKFIGLYIAGNLLYGFYVTYFEPRPDPTTHMVSIQTAFLLNLYDLDVTSVDQVLKPTCWLIYDNRTILSVYEGCNGLNTMIIFIAFVVGFGPVSKKMIWFIVMGILMIHIVNLLRIGVLFFVAEYWPTYMYFTHKYFFTAILYLVVFLMWMLWVKKFSSVEKA
jgi:exosortase family protein XrtF